MERRYYRQYESYKNVVPRKEDFPVLEFNDTEEKNTDEESRTIAAGNVLPFNLKLDDIIILVLLFVLLSEQEKDTSTILVLAFLFLAEYIF